MKDKAHSTILLVEDDAIIADNGTGLPHVFSDLKKGFGYMLIDMLVKQLQGKYSITGDNGTRCSIECEISGSIFSHIPVVSISSCSGSLYGNRLVMFFHFFKHAIEMGLIILTEHHRYFCNGVIGLRKLAFGFFIIIVAFDFQRLCLYRKNRFAL